MNFTAKHAKIEEKYLYFWISSAFSAPSAVNDFQNLS